MPTHLKTETPNDLGVMAQAVGRRWRAVVDGELGRCGLTASTWRVLFFLGQMGNGVRPKDLAEALDMERPSLVQLVDKMERENLIRRQDDPADRRGKTLHMTEHGADIHRQAEKVARAVADRLTANITDQEFALTKTVFEKILTAIDLEGNRTNKI